MAYRRYIRGDNVFIVITKERAKLEIEERVAFGETHSGRQYAILTVGECS